MQDFFIPSRDVSLELATTDGVVEADEGVGGANEGGQQGGALREGEGEGESLDDTLTEDMFTEDALLAVVRTLEFSL